MAIVKCENCGSEVSNVGKCPKCGVLMCTECGHTLTGTELKCGKCGKGTDRLRQKLMVGKILLVSGVLEMFVTCSFTYNASTAYMGWTGATVSIVLIVLGLVYLYKYAKIKQYS